MSYKCFTMYDDINGKNTAVENTIVWFIGGTRRGVTGIDPQA